MKRIEIRTAQNVIIEYELAGLKDRFIALFIDFVLIYFTYFVLVWMALFLFYINLPGSDAIQVIIFAIGPLTLFLLYQFFSETYANGQSLGKKALGIKVARLDGREPGLSEYLLRTLFHLVDTFFSFGTIGAFLIGSSSKNQRLGDLTSNTTVIKVKSDTRFKLEDILNIHTLENYEPEFPVVKQLREQDMLLIKETLKRHRAYNNKAHAKAIDKLVEKLMVLLEVEDPPKNKVEFLKTLIRDYIVLTR